MVSLQHHDDLGVARLEAAVRQSFWNTQCAIFVSVEDQCGQRQSAFTSVSKVTRGDYGVAALLMDELA